MEITKTHVTPHSVPLVRPYSIAGRHIDAVELFYLEIETAGSGASRSAGLCGLGAASPAPTVTGETAESCAQALSEGLGFLLGRDARGFGALQAEAAERLAATPAALAACDMALWDLAGKCLQRPVVDLLGARNRPLPTSITLGIKDTADMLAEAQEYLERGFRCLKVKIGDDFEKDVERLTGLRRLCGRGAKLRVDANQGYDAEQPAMLEELANLAERFDLELIEQPFERGREPRRVPPSLSPLLAADESVHDAADGLAVAKGGIYGILNIKLMKCGGITGGRRLAAIAEAGGLELMWGCMDESVISIAAALHVASASPATRYLDLDGSFDLPSDLAVGGFELRGDHLHLLERPGLGVEWLG